MVIAIGFQFSDVQSLMFKVWTSNWSLNPALKFCLKDFQEDSYLLLSWSFRWFLKTFNLKASRLNYQSYSIENGGSWILRLIGSEPILFSGQKCSGPELAVDNWPLTKKLEKKFARSISKSSLFLSANERASAPTDGRCLVKLKFTRFYRSNGQNR